jgi:hypothetical protein
MSIEQLITIIVSIGIFITIGTYISSAYATEEICINKGFEGVRQSGSLENCYLKLDFNKQEGKYDYCYMPVIYNNTANEWCNITTSIILEAPNGN